MHRLTKVTLAVVVAFGLLEANPAQALPLSLNTCLFGCGAFGASGGGSIEATLEIVNGNDFLITLTNSLNSAATNDRRMSTGSGFCTTRRSRGRPSRVLPFSAEPSPSHRSTTFRAFTSASDSTSRIAGRVGFRP
ncbi:MAG TPA: hypothetical protein VHJ77_16155 [Vicinamibacterales bacterium]|nr:hypothetical protein [Vicinamibacterales bacterium]